MSAKKIIYLDHAATAPTDPRVVEAMLPWMTERFGNPSSVYGLGSASQEAISRARGIVADILGASRKEIIFTSGGSESINLAVKGSAFARRESGGKHVITVATEHHATLHAVESLQKFGFETTILPVDKYGRVSAEQVRDAIRADTSLVSVMYANNEVGTVHPIEEIGAVCRERGVLFHVDGVQAVAAFPLDVSRLRIDMLSLSGHKFYGPKGAGILYVRQGTPLDRQIDGGGQESKRRAGTENVPGIVGIATALKLATEEMEKSFATCTALRNRLIEGIQAKIPQAHLNGHPTERAPGNVHVTFDWLEGHAATESILVQLDAQGVCASTGSACNSRALEPSHVLTAMGLDASRAFSSVRFTVGKENTQEEIDHVLGLLPPIVDRLRKVSPGYQRFLAESQGRTVSSPRRSTM